MHPRHPDPENTCPIDVFLEGLKEQGYEILDVERLDKAVRVKARKQDTGLEVLIDTANSRPQTLVTVRLYGTIAVYKADVGYDKQTLSFTYGDHIELPPYHIKIAVDLEPEEETEIEYIVDLTLTAVIDSKLDARLLPRIVRILEEYAHLQADIERFKVLA